MILSGVRKGDEVIVPSLTFAATANAVVYCGATPVFAEINPDTLNVSPQSISDRITERTKAVIVVHLSGVPCEMNEIVAITQEENLSLVEDCAHAHGAYYHGKACGAFGDYACFSFYPTKIIPSAEGGLLATSNEDIDAKARTLINQGRCGLGPKEITEIGYNYRMNELQAILVRVQMESLEEIVTRRRRIVERYRRNLAGSSGVTIPQVSPKARPAYYSFSVLVDAEIRNPLRDRLLDDGIETSILYHPTHLQPVYRRMFGYKPNSLPITEELSSRIISLPLHLGLDIPRVDYVCEKLVKGIDVLEC